MSGDSFQMLGMAERGMIPAIFAVRSRFGTPTWAIFLNFVTGSACALMFIQQLLELLNVIYVCVMWAFLLQACSFLALRVYHPPLASPVPRPCQLFGCISDVYPKLLLHWRGVCVCVVADPCREHLPFPCRRRSVFLHPMVPRSQDCEFSGP
jgi:hypothetical protein